VVLVIAVSLNSFSQKVSFGRTNLEIIDSLIAASSDKFCAYLIKTSQKDINLKINKSDGYWLLTNKLLNTAKAKNISFYLNDTSKTIHDQASIVNLTLNMISIEYTREESDADSLVRSIRTELIGYIQNKDGKTEQLPVYSETFIDTIAADNVPYLETSLHSFTHSQVPPAPHSFFKEIAEPIIIIGTAIITVILFFTVRSG
jgi:hypothetical protein